MEQKNWSDSVGLRTLVFPILSESGWIFMLIYRIGFGV